MVHGKLKSMLWWISYEFLEFGYVIIIFFGKEVRINEKIICAGDVGWILMMGGWILMWDDDDGWMQLDTGWITGWAHCVDEQYDMDDIWYYRWKLVDEEWT